MLVIQHRHAVMVDFGQRNLDDIMQSVSFPVVNAVTKPIMLAAYEYDLIFLLGLTFEWTPTHEIRSILSLNYKLTLPAWKVCPVLTVAFLISHGKKKILSHGILCYDNSENVMFQNGCRWQNSNFASYAQSIWSSLHLVTIRDFLQSIVTLSYLSPNIFALFPNSLKKNLTPMQNNR